MLADGYLEGFFERNPDQVTLFGVTGRHHDALPDNSLDALKAWQAKEDGWLGQATQIDPATIEAPTGHVRDGGNGITRSNGETEKNNRESDPVSSVTSVVYSPPAPLN